jgi:type IV secretion system protein VirD4
MIDHEQMRYGSARWAERSEIVRAGLMLGRGLHIGYLGKERLSLDSDAPGILFAGSGSGKGRDYLIETILRSGLGPLLVMDPKGELAACTIASFLRWGAFMWLWNPCGLHGLPQHRVNPLDILTRDSPRLHADTKFIAAGLIPLSGGKDGHYFELRAREWVEAIIKSLIEQRGSVTFPAFWCVVQAIESNGVIWDAQLSRMERSAFPDVRAAGAEMWAKQQKTHGNEFGAILGTIKAHLSFLSDPMLLASLDNPNFSLKDLTGQQLASVFALVPREYIRLWSPVLRVIFTVTMLYKSRAPAARRITMLIDEAGQMGRFEALLDAFTYGRGAGVRTIALFQDIGQIVSNYGAPAVQGFLGSSQLRLFFGVRDLETATLISRILGNETLSFNDTKQQEEARMRRVHAMRAFMEGSDPFTSAFDVSHYGRASEHRSTMQRALMTPDEIINMPEHRMIALITGLYPIYEHKYPYFTRRDLNGLWLPNPLVPQPQDRVTLPAWLWSRTRRVITEEAPPHLAHFPQHDAGIRYVEGFRPW